MITAVHVRCLLYLRRQPPRLRRKSKAVKIGRLANVTPYLQTIAELRCVSTLSGLPLVEQQKARLGASQTAGTSALGRARLLAPNGNNRPASCRIRLQRPVAAPRGHGSGIRCTARVTVGEPMRKRKHARLRLKLG